MDRRNFLKAGAAAFVAAEVGTTQAFASEFESAVNRISEGSASYPCEGAVPGPEDMHLRFLGTGSAGWKPGSSKRRHSSVLLDGKVLIDYTVAATETMPEGCHPQAVFFTHSHGDHFSPEETVKAGIPKVYLSETWHNIAVEMFNKAANELGMPVPEIIPVKIGQRYEEGGLSIMPLPANHATAFFEEQALIYLVEKGTTEEKLGVRLLYATDTGGIMGWAGRLAGIDFHIKPGRPITAFIMEATMGFGKEEDFRIMNHTSVDFVAKTIHMLEETGRYTPPEGQPAYTTHMSTIGWPDHDSLVGLMPKPLRPAYDGLEVVFRSC